MPVTRQEKKIRGLSTEQSPSDSTATSATEASLATGSTTTAGTEVTASTAPDTSATSAPSAVSQASVAAPPATPSIASTMPADATRLKPPAAREVPGRTRDIDASTVKMKRTVTSQEPKTTPQPRAPSKKGGGGESTSSFDIKLALAKEKWLRLQVELAATQYAILEAQGAVPEEELEDADSVHSATEVNERVDNWLETQEQRPLLAIAGAPHVNPTEAPTINNVGPQNVPEHQQAPAGAQSMEAQSGMAALTEAITRAVMAARTPKFVELPVFNGSHHEWLPFRAAYYETESSFTLVENINRLRRNLKGKAKEAVEMLLITSAPPSDIMNTLESRFGRPEAIAAMEIETLRSLPRLTDSPRDICIFASRISNVVATLKVLGCESYMHHPDISNSIVDKFTPWMRFRYYDFTSNLPDEEPALLKLEKYLKKEVTVCGKHAKPEQVTPPAPTSQLKRSQKINTVTEKTYKYKCPVCSEEHSSTECEQFKKMEINTRWETAKSKRMCFRCLRYRGANHRCRSKVCGINSCKSYHNEMLHHEKATEKQKDEDTEVINSAWTIKKKQSYLKIIPVRVEGPRGAINTFALLDDGSTVTLIDNSVAESIGAKGRIDPLRIETINEMKTAELASRRVSFKLRGLNHHEEHIQARTVRNLQVASQRVSREMVDGCEHLADIRDYLSYAEVKPQILIGQDNWHLLVTSEVRRGNRTQPVASLTPLGWVLHGCLTRTFGRSIDYISHVTERDEDLEALVKQYFEMDGLCIKPRKPTSDPEERSLRILENVTRRTQEGRYETGLLWKQEEVTFPDNYHNSLKRLYNIEKKMDRDLQLKEKYEEQMEALIAKGYAEPAPEKKAEGKTWYLPHFAVINPMKPEKLRVVHDAAAKTRGIALNDLLLKGPDLLQSLPGVVMRFRQHKIAVTADIKEMFMQVKLRTEDRDALRYLWRRDRRDNQPPEEYRMTSLIFGASSSPSTAIYVKNLNAKEHANEHPEAAAAIINKHYVDDYLDSFRSLEDAERITKSVRDVHKKAHFELKQWKSNSSKLLEALGEKEPTEDKKELYKSEEKTERVLGVIWDLDEDELTFNLNMARIAPTNGSKAPTKREALRIVMSLFDPLGFASPVTTKAKQLLQEVWRRGTSWDEEIDEDLGNQWGQWMVHLENLRDVKIPRRYLSYSDATSLQLHIFTDASEVAYAAILFWRAVAPNGDVSLSLVVAKAKVAPLKLTSIPRLELQAAVLGTRLAETVINEHERPPDTKVFWTDSKTALAWIRTGPRSYKPYVAHRLAAIEEASKVNEWRWVPTKLNVADDATRDVPAAFDRHHRWYKGPDFLYQTEEHWPIETSKTEKMEPSGEERVHHVHSKKKPRLAEALPDVSRFSSWDRLRYATGRVLQFIQLSRIGKESVNYRRTRKNTEADPSWKKTSRPASKKQNTVQQITSPNKKYLPASAELLKKAEMLLMRSSQEESFAEEIEDLKNGKAIQKESRLHQLSIEHVDNTIRLRSRIRATTDVPDDFKSPIVLDGDHPTVRLWIEAIHRRMHHAGVEATVNECRQQYWVLRLRPVTRMIIRRCLFCRMKTQAPPYPRTGDLPACRLAHHKRPFTYTGLDYFGPLSVAVGRTRQKRYVAIFTCLTMRAIHLEIAGSLSTDSAIMALRRMMARRGCPTEIWSDNGTNLKGADKELRRAIDDATAEEAAKKTISWRYIPPGAPFMGGAWERMVRSVKTALTATLHERHPTEEVLSTLLAEVEYTVNSRPLTHVSVSPDDPEALTPNHFLLGGPGRVPLPGTFDERDAISKSSWRSAQRLADMFWTRWVKEYLPELQHRREPHGRGPAVAVGDLVQIVDANLPRNVWIRGRVIATYPGPDGVVRAVDIRTKGGVLRRPVRKLVILPLDDVPAPTDSSTSSNGGRDVRDD